MRVSEMPRMPRAQARTALRWPVRITAAVYALVIVLGFVWFWQDLIFSDRQNAVGTHTNPSALEVGEGLTVNKMKYHEGWSLAEDPDQGKPTIVDLEVTNQHGPGLMMPGDREVLVDIFFYRGDTVVYEVLCSSDGEIAPGQTVTLDCGPYLYDWTEDYDRIEFVQSS